MCGKVLYVKFVCEVMYVKFVCVKLLYVKDKVACVREAAGGRRRREEAAPGIQNQKQEPHTKLWGKRFAFEAADTMVAVFGY